MRAKKSLGQNFLMHQATADRIADAASLTKNDTVLEIGPGTGMLTRALLQRAGKVIAIEADPELVATLQETFADAIAAKDLDLRHVDVREVDLATLPHSYALVANIPYYITGELIRTFLTTENKPSSITFLVQKEVAERIARSKKESLLSLAVKAYGTPKLCFNVPRGAFVPAPNVDSAVLRIENISNPFTSSKEEDLFFSILHAGFAHKRKLLIRNLEAVASPEMVQKALSEAKIPSKARAEDVQLGEWKILASVLAI
jgi:16S rRNA (adenine1518-N6/adenine1519-N6)-dimethyltransferase